MFGCQIFVMNFILGGSNGYCLGIVISISKTPFSYGVPSGPWIDPRRCRISPSLMTFACTPEVSFFPTSFSSFMIRPFAAADILETSQRETNQLVMNADYLTTTADLGSALVRPNEQNFCSTVDIRLSILLW